eukprot:4350381-Pleurochrysis_carterae.AAC.1
MGESVNVNITGAENSAERGVASRGDPRGAPARRALRPEPPSPFQPQPARAADSPAAEHCPAPRTAGDGAAT